MTNRDRSEFDVNDFRLIGEMTREDMINEIISGYRAEVAQQDTKSLKEIVVAKRLDAIKHRLLKEAGLVLRPGLFGQHVEEAD